MSEAMDDDEQNNVFGEPIGTCSLHPMTGFYRTGCCETGPDDAGIHTVCVEVTAEFLAFSKAHGNDLSTPLPITRFSALSSLSFSYSFRASVQAAETSATSVRA